MYETNQYDFDVSGDESRDLYIQQLDGFTTCGHSILDSTNIERTYTALSEIIGGLVARDATQVKRLVDFFLRESYSTILVIESLLFEYFCNSNSYILITMLQKASYLNKYFYSEISCVHILITDMADTDRIN